MGLHLTRSLAHSLFFCLFLRCPSSPVDDDDDDEEEEEEEEDDDDDDELSQ